LDHVLVYSIVLMFMIGLTSFDQMFDMLWVNFWPKFTYAFETIEWTFEIWHLVVGLLE